MAHRGAEHTRSDPDAIDDADRRTIILTNLAAIHKPEQVSDSGTNDRPHRSAFQVSTDPASTYPA